MCNVQSLFPYRLLFPDLSSRLSPALWDTTIPRGGSSATQDAAPASGARWLGKTVSRSADGVLIVAGYGTLEVPDAGWPQGPCHVVIAEEKNGRWHAKGRHKFPTQWWTDAVIRQVDTREARSFFIVTLDWHKPSSKISDPVQDAYVFEWTGKSLKLRFSKRLSSGKRAVGALRFATRPWTNDFPVLQLTEAAKGEEMFLWNGKSYKPETKPRPLHLKP